MSVNAGLGAMCAIEGIVHLTNELYPILSPDSTECQDLSKELLGKIFGAYRAKHLKRLKHIYDISCRAVRFEAQRTIVSRLIANYILPWCSNAARLRLFGGIIGGQPMLNHIPRNMSKPINILKA